MVQGEMFFYGGITLFIIAVILFLFNFLLIKLKKARLALKFEREYGEELERDGHPRTFNQGGISE